MSQIAVQNSTESKAVVTPYLTHLFDKIREKAYLMFEGRGHEHGFDLHDWLTAERDLLWSAPAEVVDAGPEFEVHLAVPGFEAKEIQLDATQGSIDIKAESSHREEKNDKNALWSEYSERTLSRRVEFPSPIDVSKVTAVLDNDVLVMKAPKAEAKRVARAAA